LVQGEERRGLS